MRRLLIATVLGAALSTPAFAADADDVQPALTIAPATLAAAAHAGTTAATADFATRSTFKYGRPSMLPALYATSAALQGFDAYSTLTALKSGAHEANPVMKSVTKSPVAFVAMKAGMTAASIMAAEQLWKSHHRTAAIGLMVASNVMMGMVARHNSQVLSSLK
jgi:opacity protein-like surface antigen